VFSIYLTNGDVAWEIPHEGIDIRYAEHEYLPPDGWWVCELKGSWYQGICGEWRKINWYQGICGEWRKIKRRQRANDARH
jgi:hypothetical protein